MNSEQGRPSAPLVSVEYSGWEGLLETHPCPVPPTCSSYPQISYQSIESSDPAVNVPGPRRTISKLRNETYHVFSNLQPGTTYLFSVRARTSKGFGQAALTEITTNISGELPWDGARDLRAPRIQRGRAAHVSTEDLSKVNENHLKAAVRSQEIIVGESVEVRGLRSEVSA